MKKVLLLTILMSSALANPLDNLLSSRGMSNAQISNFKSGISSMLTRNSRGRIVETRESKTLGDCLELMSVAKEEVGSTKTGFLTHPVYKSTIEGSYEQRYFISKEDNSFGSLLKRGLSNEALINFNSTSSGETNPHLNSTCNSFMDITDVSLVEKDGLECRKVTLTLKALDANTGEDVSQSLENYYCEGEHSILTDYSESVEYKHIRTIE